MIDHSIKTKCPLIGPEIEKKKKKHALCFFFGFTISQKSKEQILHSFPSPTVLFSSKIFHPQKNLSQAVEIRWRTLRLRIKDEICSTDSINNSAKVWKTALFRHSSFSHKKSLNCQRWTCKLRLRWFDFKQRSSALLSVQLLWWQLDRRAKIVFF